VIFAWSKEVTGDDPNTWAGLAEDHSVYPRQLLYKLFAGYIEKTEKPGCPIACSDYSIEETYQSWVRETPLRAGSPLSLGTINVYYPHKYCQKTKYLGEYASPPNTGLYMVLEWTENGIKHQEDYTDEFGDGTVCFDCARLGFSTIPRTIKAGFTIEQPGCPDLPCEWKKTAKDP
jgi:hypothetical protein